MKIRRQIVATVLGGMLALATDAGLSAAESWSPITVKPLMAVSRPQAYRGLFPQHGQSMQADSDDR
jgi:hypothetical protein